MTNGHRTVPAPAPPARTTCQHPVVLTLERAEVAEVVACLAHAVLALVRGRDTRCARVLAGLAARIEAAR